MGDMLCKFGVATSWKMSPRHLLSDHDAKKRELMGGWWESDENLMRELGRIEILPEKIHAIHVDPSGRTTVIARGSYSFGYDWVRFTFSLDDGRINERKGVIIFPARYLEDIVYGLKKVGGTRDSILNQLLKPLLIDQDQRPPEMIPEDHYAR